MKFLLTALIAITLIGGSGGALARVSNPCEDINICFQEKQLSDRKIYNFNPDTHDNNNSYYNYDRGYDSTARLPQRIASHGERVFIFSPRLLRWAAYDSQGYRVATGKANGGSHHCKDLGRPCRTPLGTHRVHSKGTVACISRKFPLPKGGAPMPYCTFFRGGYAIHGSPYISNRNTSHGCIRVHTVAAKWLHRYFLNHGTKVVVLPY